MFQSKFKLEYRIKDYVFANVFLGECNNVSLLELAPVQK
jgi:hypothetical protein